MKLHIKYFLSLALIIVLINGCFSPPDLPNAPEITFNGIQYELTTDVLGNRLDSVTVSIEFKDGDGDLGAVSTSDPTNYFITVNRKESGVFNEVTFPGGANFNGRFLINNGQDLDGAIEGRLDYGFNIFIGTIQPSDTLQFDVFIRDRAGNQSNTVTTSQIVINP